MNKFQCAPGRHLVIHGCAPCQNPVHPYKAMYGLHTFYTECYVRKCTGIGGQKHEIILKFCVHLVDTWSSIGVHLAKVCAPLQGYLWYPYRLYLILYLKVHWHWWPKSKFCALIAQTYVLKWTSQKRVCTMHKKQGCFRNCVHWLHKHMFQGVHNPKKMFIVHRKKQGYFAPCLIITQFSQRIKYNFYCI